ncbi:VWA domain-containing protein [Treponema parvum]|uniref:VWA domain-containing protein n=1 Tax=Treponema parvum TaxID=138851 RepID=A0A975F5E9_9SPIR|nr:vWA domain-containing protein [Treponema parvum]QTQ14628.1 VWA domain-containing protein [Treponema parvum]
MKKFTAFFLSSLLAAFFLSAQSGAADDLWVTQSDIRLVPKDGSDFSSVTGYDLYIKKKPGIESVLLTETTKDPEGKKDNYAYRALEWNAVNGDEIRYLDGKVLDSKYARYSLVDSSASEYDDMGECFHIYIPANIVFGYPWSRNGSVKIGRGFFINIRTFEKKYADYTGRYFDNPFMFDLGRPVERQPEIKAPEAAAPEAIPDPPKEISAGPVLTDAYNPVAAEKFKEISEELIYSAGPSTIIDDIMQPINSIAAGSTVDCVFAIDATGSMQDDIEKLRKEWIPRLLEDLKKFNRVRLGLILYRDYVDSWRYRNLPLRFFDFTDDLNVFLKNLNDFEIKGFEGGDIPEAVYEALYASIEFYRWRPAAVKKIILIGDAEPHPRPRGTGRYSKELIEELSVKKGISVNAIILPDDKASRGR